MPFKSATFLALTLSANVARADAFYCWVEGDVVNCSDREPPRSKSGPKIQRVDYGGSKFFPKNIDQYDDIFRQAARAYDLPFAYLKAIAKVESNFEAKAVSRANAKGVMQLIDGTAELMNVRNPFDPRESIFAGARYLRLLSDRFEGDLRLMAAAYNAGPERVRRAGGIPEIPETQRYVRRVLETYEKYKSESG